MDLSVCMIVKNEEPFIEGCLKGVAGWADEVVVVDTGSTDRTPDICRSYGVRLLEWEWRGDFSAARNVSLGAARGDWALVLDADERIGDADRAKIKGLVARRVAEAYFVRLECPAAGGMTRFTEWGRQCRLFRNRPWARYRGPVHEQVVDSFLERGAMPEDTDVVILHLGYDQDPVAVRVKWERNRALLEEHLRQFPDDHFRKYLLGRQYLSLGRLENARRLLAGLAGSSLTPRHLRAPVLNDLAMLEAGVGKDPARARVYASQSLALGPGQALPHFILGLAFEGLGDLPSAAAAYREYEVRSPSACSVADGASDVSLDPQAVAGRLLAVLPPGAERQERLRSAFSAALAGLSAAGREAFAMAAENLDDPSVRARVSALPPEEREAGAAALRFAPGCTAPAAVVERAWNLLESVGHRWKSADALCAVLDALVRGRRPSAARRAIRSLGDMGCRVGPSWFSSIVREWGGAGLAGFRRLALEEGVRRFPEDATLARTLGVEYVDAGLPGKAVPLLHVAARRVQDEPEGWYMLGLAAHAAGDKELVGEAVAALERCGGSSGLADKLKATSGRGDPGFERA